MIYSQENYDNDNLSNEQRTAMTLSDIANTLNSNIQFTWDSPELNSDESYQFWI